jgi:hypothetical protein
VIHHTPSGWVPLAKAVDDPTKGYRIAVTGGVMTNRESWFAYGLLGTKLQNELVYVPPTTDGKIIEDLVKLKGIADRDAWIARLREEKIAYVVALNPDAVEIGWMNAAPEIFHKLLQPGGRGVWKLNPFPGPLRR